MSSFGIGSIEDYKDGNWYGNSSMDGAAIFNSVTYSFSDLIESVDFHYQNGKKVRISSASLELALQPRTIKVGKYGRCYEITLFNEKISLFFFRFEIKKDLEIFFNIPNQFFTNSRTRIISKASERIYLPVIYEILMSNHDPNCREYSNSFSGSYDQCKESYINEKLKRKLNCTVPYALESEAVPLCQGSMAVEASKIYKEYFLEDSEECPSPCQTMLTNFGWPKYSNGSGRAQFYFNSIVKVTEDFISYDLLRWVLSMHKVHLNS